MKIIKILVCVLFLSCSEGVVYEEYQKINSEGWFSEKPLVYKFTINDTVSSYKIKLHIRHQTEYEYQNLIFFVHTNRTDTIDINLCDKYGKWFGSGFGDIRDLSVVLNSQKKFDRKKEHTIVLEQAMRFGKKEKIKHLKNIKNIGIQVLKNE